MNKLNLVKNENEKWCIDYSDLKNIQLNLQRTESLASREQLVNLTNNIIRSVIKSTFENKSAYYFTLTTVEKWIAEVDPCDYSQKGELDVCLMHNKILSTLSQYYIIADEAELCDFIDKFNYPIDFLVDAALIIKKFFGTSTKIELSLQYDPNLVDDEGLFASIKTNLPVEDALNKVDYLDVNWFIPNQARGQGRFMFDVDWD